MQLTAHAGQLFEANDHVAAADINIMFQADGDRLRTERFGERAVIGPDILDRRLDAARQDCDLLTLAHYTTGNLTTQSTEVVQGLVGGIVRTIHPLNRETERVEIPVTRNVDGFEMR